MFFIVDVYLMYFCYQLTYPVWLWSQRYLIKGYWQIEPNRKSCQYPFMNYLDNLYFFLFSKRFIDFVFAQGTHMFQSVGFASVSFSQCSPWKTSFSHRRIFNIWNWVKKRKSNSSFVWQLSTQLICGVVFTLKGCNAGSKIDLDSCSVKSNWMAKKVYKF